MLNKNVYNIAIINYIHKFLSAANDNYRFIEMIFKNLKGESINE